MDRKRLKRINSKNFYEWNGEKGEAKTEHRNFVCLVQAMCLEE